MPSIQPVPYQTLVRIFERDGFRFARQSGDHLIYIKPGRKRPLVIPAYRSVPVFIIRNLLRTAACRESVILNCWADEVRIEGNHRNKRGLPPPICDNHSALAFSATADGDLSPAAPWPK